MKKQLSNSTCRWGIQDHKICIQKVSKVTPKTLPKHIQNRKNNLGLEHQGVPGGVPVDYWMPKMVIQVPKKEPPGLQNDTSEYWKVIPTRISNALECENRVMTSILRGFEMEETLNQDFDLELILSSRQPFNLTLKSKKL